MFEQIAESHERSRKQPQSEQERQEDCQELGEVREPQAQQGECTDVERPCVESGEEAEMFVLIVEEAGLLRGLGEVDAHQERSHEA